MKKLKYILASVLLCLAAGCDTNIPVKEIAPELTPMMRCGLTGGMPLSEYQAKMIGMMADLVLNPDCWDGNKLRSDTDLKRIAAYANNPDADDLFDLLKRNSLASHGVQGTNKDVLEGIKAKLNGHDLQFDSPYMVNIYAIAFEEYGVPDKDDRTYCACGNEFCDYGVGCAKEEVTDTLVCAYNTTLLTGTADDKCNPFNIKRDALASIIRNHSLPLFTKLGVFSQMASQITDTSNLVDYDTGNGNIVKMPYVQALNQRGINDAIKKNCEADNIKGTSEQNQCRSAKTTFASLIECITGSTVDKAGEGDLQYCRIGPVLVNGATTNVSLSKLGNSYYVQLRKIGELLFEDDEEYLALSASERSDFIDTFLIEQVNVLLTGLPSLASKLSGSSEITDDALFEVMQDLLSLYKGKHAEQHRKFYSHVALTALTDTELSKLFQQTFSVKLSCVNNESPIGNNQGLKKYCIANDSEIGVREIMAHLKKSNKYLSDFADALVMSSDYKFKLDDHDVVVSVGSQYVKVDDNYISGRWLILDCPGGASCSSVTGQCGSCRDSDYLYPRYGSDGKLSEAAICVDGQVIPMDGYEDDSRVVKEGTCTTNNLVICEDIDGVGYLGVCSNGKVRYTEKHSCMNVMCNSDHTNCDNQHACTAADAKAGATRCELGYTGTKINPAKMECRADGANGGYSYQLIYDSVQEYCMRYGCNEDRTGCANEPEEGSQGGQGGDQGGQEN